VVSMVRKAARLAVYDETIMRVKNHQILATMRVDTALQFHTVSSINGTHSHNFTKHLMEGTQR
jgi:hypothetical protein